MTVIVSIPKLKNLDSCDECFSDLVESSGFVVCSVCGLVHDRILAQPKRYFSSIAQIIEIVHVGSINDFNGRLKKLNQRSYKTHDSFQYYYKTLQKICDVLALPDNTKIRTLQLFKNLCDDIEKYRTLLNNQHISSALAFLSIYQATKEHKILISFNQIYNAFTEFSNKLSRNTIGKLLREFNYSQRFTVYDYIVKFESELLSSFPGLEQNTEEVLELAKLKRFFQGVKPSNFALACLHITYYKKENSIGIVSKLQEMSGTIGSGIHASVNRIKTFLKREAES